MNWYSGNIKISQIKRPVPVTRFYVDPYKEDGREYVNFVHQKNDGTEYIHTTKRPLPIGEVTSLNYGDIYQREFENENLTNRNSKLNKDRINRQIQESMPKKNSIEKVSPPIDQKKPQQLEFGFMSRRSQLIHSKVKLQEMKRDNLTA